jgi:hypothetical protein
VTDVVNAEGLEPLTDEELTAFALAADPDVAVDDDAVSLWQLVEPGADGLLPEWYMPSPARGLRRLRGWRRWVVLFVIASFLLIEAYGLCSTYGRVVAA